MLHITICDITLAKFNTFCQIYNIGNNLLLLKLTAIIAVKILYCKPNNLKYLYIIMIIPATARILSRSAINRR